MSRRSILPLAAVLLALAPVAASAAADGTTVLLGGLDLPPGAIAGGQSGNAGSDPDRARVSADGRYVAFVSQADTLDSDAHPDVVNVYRKDRFTGHVVLVSRPTGTSTPGPAASSDMPAISDDGARVGFRTSAALDPADDDDGASDVYVRDVGAGTTTLATVGPSGVQTAADVHGFDLSGNGRYVAFAVADALVPAIDANGVDDVYQRDLVSATTALVSISTGGGRAGNALSADPSVSDDGVWVAFASAATNVASYTPGTGSQIFARDLTARRTHLVSSRSSSTTGGANGASTEPDLAGAPASARTDRVVVAYTSEATNIVAADTAPAASVLRRLLSSSGSTLVSRADGAAGANASGPARWPSISADGARVAFSSDAGNLGAGTDSYGVYVRYVTADRTLLASDDNAFAVRGALSGGGGFLAWYEEGGVTPDSDPDYGAVYGRTYDAASSSLGAPQLISRPSGSAPFLATWIAVEPTGPGARTISADGRYVVFAASTTRLLGGAPGRTQVYRRDTLTGALELVSRADDADGEPADGLSGAPTISADGMRVAFASSAQLDPSHPGGTAQAYVRDLAAGTTTLASRAEGAGGAAAGADVADPRISADGEHVAFLTSARNLGAADGRSHAYLRDLDAARTLLVDRASGVAGAIGNDEAGAVSPSADGRRVAFSSRATNLHPDDAAGVLHDVYVRDTVVATTTLVSRRGGVAGAHATGSSTQPAISADGTVVAFRAEDETLAPEAGDWDGAAQVVARTLATGQNVLVSRAPDDGPPADAGAADPSVSGDGAVVAFSSAATNLLPGVGGDTRDGVFARTLASGVVDGPPAFGILGNDPPSGASFPSINDDGQCLAFAARGHNDLTGTAGDVFTTYMHVVSGTCPTPAEAELPIDDEASDEDSARRVGPLRLRAPAITARLTNARFRVGRAATARAAARRVARSGGAAPVGTTFVVAPSMTADVAIRIERPAEGRIVGRFCRAPRPHLRRNLRCIRMVTVGSIARRDLSAGRHRIAFSGRVGRRALRPGLHRARVRALNAGGSSRWVRLPFRVVQP
jgi:Tol biopolymer transport system component